MRVWIALALVAAGCTATDTGNPVQLGVQGYDAGAAGALTLSAGWAVNEAWVVLASLRLGEGDDCSASTPVGAEMGPLAAELLSGEVLPARPDLDGTTGQYCRLDLKFHKLNPGDAGEVPAELAGLSMRVVGVAPDARPFVLEADFTDPWHLQSSGAPFALDGDALVLGFAMDTWLQAADLDAAEGADGIRITRTDNRELYQAFTAAVRASGRLLADDGDGLLSGSEAAAAPLAHGE